MVFCTGLMWVGDVWRVAAAVLVSVRLDGGGLGFGRAARGVKGEKALGGERCSGLDDASSSG